MILIKKLHKWLSVIITLQLLIWLGSGLFFNLMDHSKARGNANRVSAKKEVNIDYHRLVEPTTVLAKYHKPVMSIKQIELLGQPYYLLNHTQNLYLHFYNEYTLVNAYTGEEQIVDFVMAQAIANASYKGSADILSTVKVSPPVSDFLKEQNTLWQVNYNDELNTSVYIDSGSGRLVGHSNDDKRFADFIFKLHFMDYGIAGKLGSFNNGLIVFFALITLFFCLTGAIWVVDLAKKGRYKLT